MAQECILAEQELRDISRNVKAYIPGGQTQNITEDDLNKFTKTFETVIQTSWSNRLASSHRVAAWNTLCALIDQCCDSSHKEVRGALWQRNLWHRCFDLYLDQSQNARPKSSKQLLVSLTTVLIKDSPSQDTREIKVNIVERLLRVLKDENAHGYTKSSLIMLTHFLAKDIVSMPDIFAAPAWSDAINESIDDKEYSSEKFLEVILEWVNKGDLGPVIAQLVSTVLNKIEASPEVTAKSIASPPGTDLPAVWIGPLKLAVEQDLDSLDSFRIHIFPALFKRNIQHFVGFVRAVGLDTLMPSSGTVTASVRISPVLFASLQAGKEIGLIVETDHHSLEIGTTQLGLPVSFIGNLLHSADRAARLAGLSLLITSHSVTRPFSQPALKVMQRSWSHLHADTDANFRSELFSLTQKLFDRMRASSGPLSRRVAMPVKDQDAGRSLDQQKVFFKQYLRFLTWELRPSASYQRHISALKCLSVMFRSGLDGSIPSSCLTKSATGDKKWSFHMPLVSPPLQRLLTDLLVDPFDDVRQAAASVLGLLPQSGKKEEIVDMQNLDAAMEKAEALMLASGRADHADGVAHLYSSRFHTCQGLEEQSKFISALIAKVDNMLSIAENDLAVAVDRYPLHGLLISLRYVFAQSKVSLWQDAELIKGLDSILSRLWELVKPVLCNDAPEGYMPDEVEDAAEVSTKEILSFCWRALKEASLLMGVLVATSPNRQPGEQHTFADSLVSLTFTQLSDLRHRGAFSAVAQTWTACCQYVQKDITRSDLQIWQNRTFELLRGRVTINTRRSAGLPALLCGILIADPTETPFKQTFQELETIARSPVDAASVHEGSLPQVHSMNCMKDILKNTRLAEQSENYVPAALQLAADSLRSEAWAIRNCGLMLFRAVIDRLLGTNDAFVEDDVVAKRSVDFEQQPQLLDTVTALLSSQTVSVASDPNARNEGVFPALQLLQRAHIPASRKESIQQSLSVLMSSPSWHVRDKAARTFATTVPITDTAAALEGLLNAGTSDQNSLHGALLCAKHLLRRLQSRRRSTSKAGLIQQLDTIEKECSVLVSQAEHSLLNSNPCYITRDEFSMLLVICNIFVENAHNTLSSQEASLNGYLHKGEEPNTVEEKHLNQHKTEDVIAEIMNPAEADQWLMSLGQYLDDQIASSCASGVTLPPECSNWVFTCKAAMSDSSIFSREAVAKSLRSTPRLWLTLCNTPRAAALLRSLCLTIYDLLNDDDEDIRVLAAITACKIIACGETSSTNQPQVDGLVPLVASQNLVKWMTKRWPRDDDLICDAFFRAFALSSDEAFDTSKAIQDKSKQDTELFAQEKQNLYIDESREVRIWSRAIMQSDAQTIPEPLIRSLAQWTSQSIETLISKSQQGDDCALGWTTEPTIFTIGLQVILAAEVMLWAVGQGVRVAVKPSDVRSRLATLASAGQQTRMNQLWLWEIERVVTGSLMSTFGAFSSVLQNSVLDGKWDGPDPVEFA